MAVGVSFSERVSTLSRSFQGVASETVEKLYGLMQGLFCESVADSELQQHVAACYLDEGEGYYPFGLNILSVLLGASEEPSQ